MILICNLFLNHQHVGSSFINASQNLVLLMFSFLAFVCENNVLDSCFAILCLQFCFLIYSWVFGINLWKDPSSMQSKLQLNSYPHVSSIYVHDYNAMEFFILWSSMILFCTLSLGLWHMHVKCFFTNVLEL